VESESFRRGLAEYEATYNTASPVTVDAVAAAGGSDERSIDGVYSDFGDWATAHQKCELPRQPSSALRTTALADGALIWTSAIRGYNDGAEGECPIETPATEGDDLDLLTHLGQSVFVPPPREGVCMQTGRPTTSSVALPHVPPSGPSLALSGQPVPKQRTTETPSDRP
jgi:hypothetical protein